MSTVAEFLELVLDRVPEDKANKVMPALNAAIQVIAKRLYIFESDLVRGDLNVPIYASVEYASDSIAFVANLPEAADTITDSAAQFVAEGFEADMAITTSFTTNPGPYRITAVAVGTLTLATDSNVTVQAEGTEYTLTSRADFGYLPSDFWGLFHNAKPYIDGKTWPLVALPDQDIKLAWGSSGESFYYEIEGDRFCVIPATASDITIKGKYFKRPAKLTKGEDTMPYFELFDDVLREYLVELMVAGTASGATAQAQLLLGVDLVVAKRPRKATSLNIDWNDLARSE